MLARAAGFAPHARPALVNGGAGAVVEIGGTVRAVVAFSVAGGRIVGIDIIADPDKLRRVDIET